MAMSRRGVMLGGGAVTVLTATGRGKAGEEDAAAVIYRDLTNPEWINSKSKPHGRGDLEHGKI